MGATKQADPMATSSLSQKLVRIYHPSDFSEASHVAFAHALKISLVTGAHFHIHHVFDPRERISWEEYPGVRELLSSWKMIEDIHDKEAVGKLGLRVQKVLSESNEPLEAALAFLDRHKPDLIVLAAHQHHGIMRWLHKEMAAPLALNAHIPTLFIPHGRDGFVSVVDGSLYLKRVLIPVDRSPAPFHAVESASRFCQSLGLTKVEFTTLHIGKEGDGPAIHLPEDRERESDWDSVTLEGHVTDSIINAARNLDADLVVMATRGRHGFLDALRGSTTERVLRETNCPLLAIPE